MGQPGLKPTDHAAPASSAKTRLLRAAFFARPFGLSPCNRRTLQRSPSCSRPTSPFARPLLGRRLGSATGSPWTGFARPILRYGIRCGLDAVQFVFGQLDLGLGGRQLSPECPFGVLRDRCARHARAAPWRLDRRSRPSRWRSRFGGVPRSIAAITAMTPARVAATATHRIVNRRRGTLMVCVLQRL